MKIERDRVAFYLGQITVELYWPYIAIEKNRIHISFDTQITYHNKNNWEWNKSIVFRLAGFGFGIAHKHCKNPNVKGNIA